MGGYAPHHWHWRQCVVCDKEFQTDNPNDKYCEYHCD